METHNTLKAERGICWHHPIVHSIIVAVHNSAAMMVPNTQQEKQTCSIGDYLIGDGIWKFRELAVRKKIQNSKHCQAYRIPS